MARQILHLCRAGTALSGAIVLLACSTHPAETRPREVPQFLPANKHQFRAPAPRTPSPVTVTTVARGLIWPLSIEALPDGRFIFSTRTGELRIISHRGEVGAVIGGVPAVQPLVRGGLLDIALPPDFTRSRRIYLSYAEPTEGGNGRLAVATATISAREDALTDVRVIWRMERDSASHEHYGSRIAFDRTGNLFVTTGERSPDGGKFGREMILANRNLAQDPASTLGKIIRIAPDGSAPLDNPFIGKSGYRSDVWALGFRNVLGGAVVPATGDLWTVEHGPLSGDELNHVLPGRNYGWPIISYGKEYHGEPIGDGIAAMAGLEQPAYFWDPNIAPGGIIFYTGKLFPKWQGNILIAGLKSQRVSRLAIKNGRVRSEEWLPFDARLRDITVGIDGAVYLITDEEKARLLRLAPN